MAALIGSLIDNYNYLIYEKSDPRTNSFFLMDSPIPVLLIITSYYYFVKIKGPKMMENRKAYEIKTLMVIYNAAQSIVNAYMLYKIFTIIMQSKDPIHCMPPVDYLDDTQIQMLNTMHMYFLVKISDLSDTIFMVIRKNFHQISFLHVYHHIGMVLASWLVIKYIPSSHMAFLGIMNTFVHMLMYMYYLVTAVYPQYKKSLWWKKNITQLQLLQFCILFIQHLSALLDQSCRYPKTVLWIYLTQTLLMLYLFAQFYYNAYIKPKKRKE